MCIICSTGGDDKAFEFLDAYAKSQAAMTSAAAAMLAITTLSPGARKQYDKTYKQMVRLCKEWNKIEHKRERHVPNVGALHDKG